MNQTPQTSLPANPQDPRARADFQPQYYPKANGKDAPCAGAAERNDRLVLEFLSAYYELNCEYARLLKARTAPASAERQEAERKSLQAVERLLILRDSLEDQYAPFGVIADPVVEGGFTVNLIFSFGNVDATGKRRSEEYTITARVPIPLPEGIHFGNLPIKIEGPGINPE